MDIAVIIGFVGVFIAIGVSSFLAGEMADAAAQKGYERKRYWHICFWLGIMGYLVVIALPDTVLQEKIDKLSDMQPSEKQTHAAAAATGNYSDELPKL